MLGRRLCQASGTAFQQNSTEKRSRAASEVAKSSLEQLLPPPPSSTQLSQSPEAPHHLSLGSISLQTQGQSFTSLVRTWKEQLRALFVVFHSDSSSQGHSLSFFPSHWGFGQVQISQPARWDGGRKVGEEKCLS